MVLLHHHWSNRNHGHHNEPVGKVPDQSHNHRLGHRFPQLGCCLSGHHYLSKSTQQRHLHRRLHHQVSNFSCSWKGSIIQGFFACSKEVEPDKSEQIKEFLQKLTQLSYSTLVDFKPYTNKGYIPDNVNLKELAFQVNIRFNSKKSRWSNCVDMCIYMH